MAKKRKAPSPAQLEARRKFAEMARARAGKAGGKVRSMAAASARVGRSTSGGGMLSTITGGGMDAVWIVGGKVISRAVPAVLKMDAQAEGKFLLVAGVQLGAGLAASMAADRFISRDAGRLIFAGTAVGLLETAVRKFNVPYVSTLVGDEGDVLAGNGYTYEIVDAGPAGVGMYPGGGPGIGMYPDTGMGLYPGNAVGSYVYE